MIAWCKKSWPIILIVLVFILLNNANHWFGFYTAHQTKTSYTAMPVNNTGDYYVYLSYLEQGRQGKLMMTNLYNHLDQSHLILAPHWYLIGQFSRLTQLSTVVTYFIFRLIFSLIFIVLLLFLIKKIFPREKTWWLLALFLLANGCGAIYDPWLKSFGASATNLWMPESNIFYTLTQSPLLILSQILILVIFILFIKLWESKKTKLILWLNLSYLLLIIIHPFDLVIVALVLATWSGFTYFIQKDKKIFYYYLSLLPAITLGGAYYLWLLQDPVMQQFKTQNILVSPHVLLYIFGFGWIGVLSCLGVIYLIKQKKYQNYYLNLMLIWGLLAWVMVYLPLGFGRRLSNGWHIPLVFLSAVALIYLYQKIKPHWKISFILTSFILLSFDTWYLVVDGFYKLKQYNFIYFFSPERQQIYQQIKNYNLNHQVILSRANDAGLLPAFTGQKVYLGHEIQTWQFYTKNQEIMELWSKPQNIQAWLKANNIKYIFASQDFLPEFNNIQWLSQEPYLKQIISNEKFLLLEFNPS